MHEPFSTLELITLTCPLKMLGPRQVRSLSYDVICQVMLRRNWQIMRSVASEAVFMTSIVFNMLLQSMQAYSSCMSRHHIEGKVTQGHGL